MKLASRPVLVVVSGPMGSGKTTLAHKIARAVGCPAICRDEIKEGMVHTAPGFVAGPGDELTMRTLPVFFGVIELLLRGGVTTVAEAAFQDHLWRTGLEPLDGIARLRIVHCAVDAEVAFGRSLRRREANPLRRVHADPGPAEAAERARAHRSFDRLSLDVPWIEVDTTDGYVPGLEEIVAFATSRELRPAGVIAMNGQRVQQITHRGLRTLLDFSRDHPAGLGGFLPNGIAVGPDGVIYLDTYAGDGYTAKTALIEVRPGGQLRVLWQS